MKTTDLERVRMPPPRRCAVFEISAQLLIDLFRDGATFRFRVTDGFPADAKVIGARYEPFGGCWRIAVESEGFAEVPAYEAPPMRRPVVVERIEGEDAR